MRVLLVRGPVEITHPLVGDREIALIDVQMVLQGGTVTESAELWDEEAKKYREIDIRVCHEDV